MTHHDPFSEPFWMGVLRTAPSMWWTFLGAFSGVIMWGPLTLMITAPLVIGLIVSEAVGREQKALIDIQEKLIKVQQAYIDDALRSP